MEKYSDHSWICVVGGYLAGHGGSPYAALERAGQVLAWEDYPDDAEWIDACIILSFDTRVIAAVRMEGALRMEEHGIEVVEERGRKVVRFKEGTHDTD